MIYIGRFRNFGMLPEALLCMLPSHFVLCKFNRIQFSSETNINTWDTHGYTHKYRIVCKKKSRTHNICLRVHMYVDDIISFCAILYLRVFADKKGTFGFFENFNEYFLLIWCSELVFFILSIEGKLDLEEKLVQILKTSANLKN